jgi:hypothetical protein
MFYLTWVEVRKESPSTIKSIYYHRYLYKKNNDLFLPIPVAIFVIVFIGYFISFKFSDKSLFGFCSLNSVKGLSVVFWRGIEEATKLVPEFVI